jgi:lambda family phage minor tail protein L
MMEVSDATFLQEKNKEENKPIFLYEVSWTDSDVLYLAAFDSDISFGGQTYTAFPIKRMGLKQDIQGTSGSVKLRAANVDRAMQFYLEYYDGLRGQQVVEKMVWYNLLANTDAVKTNKFFVDSSSYNEEIVELNLMSRLNVLDLELPGRSIERSFCMWEFKSSDCGYSGGEETCNHTFERCEELQNEGRYGAFPGTPSFVTYR